MNNSNNTATVKTYVGKGKEVANYDMVNFSVCIDSLEGHTFEYEGKKYVKLTISKMKEADKFGKTHTVCVNDFKPTKKTTTEEVVADATAPEVVSTTGDVDTMPF